MVIGRPAQLIPRIFDGALMGWSWRIHTMHLLRFFIDRKPSTLWFHRMFVHLETLIPSYSIAFSRILGPRHLGSIFTTWYQETSALGFWASGGLQPRLPLVRGHLQLTWSSGILGSVSIMVSALSVMRPSSTARALTHLTIHYPVPTSYSILTVAQKNVPMFAWFWKIKLVWTNDITQKPETFREQSITS